MRHLVVGTAMLAVALGITFGTASLLQVMAEAQSHRAAATVVVEATKPAMKPAAGKERMLAPRESVIRAAANMSSL